MITQAKIKNAITDFSGVSAAYFGYQDRYRATPGDDSLATRWGATVVSGDGDRVLEGAYNVACPATAVAGTTPETCLWWEHLRRSGFVAGAGPVQPSNAFNGLLGVQTGNGAATPVAALANANGGFTNIIMCSANLPDKVAIALDVQMDDGLLNGGAVRGQLNASSNPTIADTVATTDVYAETGTNLYTLCRTF
jgi:hypothetical protein